MSRPPRSPEAWQQKVHEDQLLADEAHAARSGREIGDYRAAAVARLPELLVGIEVRMRMWEDDLRGWLEDGVFETFHGAGRTSGRDDLELRIKVEERVLGVPAPARDEDRPRYGYVRGSADTDKAPITQFGKILVRLRPSIRGRATVMLGDSMGSTECGEWACIGPELLEQPKLNSRYANQDVVDAPAIVQACDPAYRYAEVQIYGPLHPEDVNEVLFCHGVPATDDLRNSLDGWGLTFYELDGDPE